MGDGLILFGRYKNKTFNQVFEEDKEYCRLVLENHANYRGNTDEFRAFLQGKFGSKNDPSSTVDRSQSGSTFINQYFPCRMFPKVIKPLFPRAALTNKKASLILDITVTGFLKQFENHHVHIFNEIIQSPEIERVVVHEKSDLLKTDNYLGLFYGFFFRKCIHNLKNEYAMAHRCNSACNVFPIKLNLNYDKYTYDLDIFSYLKDDIVLCVQNYLKKYFFIVNDIRKEIKHLLRIIKSSGTCFKELLSLLDIDVIISQEDCYINLLKKYMFFYAIYKENKENVDNSDKDTNSEEEDLDNGEEEENKIDEKMCKVTISTNTEDQGKISKLIRDYDGSFITCAQSYRIFKFYTGDIFNILEDLFNVARLNGMFFNEDTSKLFYSESDIDKQSLKHISNYVENLKDIKKSTVSPAINSDEYCIDFNEISLQPRNINDDSDEDLLVKKLLQILGNGEKEKLNSKHFYIFQKLGLAIDKCCLCGDSDLEVGDTLLDFTYSRRSRNTMYDFYKLIVYGSLFKRKYKRLVTYNACLGEETSMEMIDNIEDVKNFIRKYRDPKALRQIIPQYKLAQFSRAQGIARKTILLGSKSIAQC